MTVVFWKQQEIKVTTWACQCQHGVFKRSHSHWPSWKQLTTVTGNPGVNGLDTCSCVLTTVFTCGKKKLATKVKYGIPVWIVENRLFQPSCIEDTWTITRDLAELNKTARQLSEWHHSVKVCPCSSPFCSGIEDTTTLDLAAHNRTGEWDTSLSHYMITSSHHTAPRAAAGYITISWLGLQIQWRTPGGAA